MLPSLASCSLRRAIGGALLAVCLGGTASAATINVTTTAEASADGRCALREAIAAANTDTAIDGCAAGAGPDIINVPTGLYSLTDAAGPLVIDSNIDIRGTGASSTVISALGQGTRVVTVTASGVAALSDVAIADGKDSFGGGIFNSGDLTLERVVVRNNEAIGQSPEYSSTGGAAGGGGGGIFNAAGANLTLRDSTLRRNRARGGNGFEGSGSGSGAGGGAGGGLFDDGGSVFALDTLFMANVARGGNGGHAFGETDISLGGGGSFVGPGGDGGASGLGGGGGTIPGPGNAPGSGGFASGGGGGAGFSTGAGAGAQGGPHGGDGGLGPADPVESGRGGGGGGAGLGGAVYAQNSGDVALYGTSVVNNTAAGGIGGFGFGTGAEGRPGEGIAAGIYASQGTLVIFGGSFEGNTTTTSDPDTFGDVRTVCGDGVLDPGEDCDDGNDSDNDDCLTTCEAPSCGDGFVHDEGEATETCDDGNDVNGDDCPTTCQIAMCGDGFVYDEGDGTEVCDDGNSRDDDECPTSCEPATCGDGFVLAGVEECDDGDDNSDSAPDACRTTCTAARCGDGVVNAGESCDAGRDNANSDSAPCRINCALPTCGNGVVNAGEQCDEGAGNGVEGSDCSSTCVLAEAASGPGATPSPNGGCAAAPAARSGWLAVLAVALLGLAARRRRRAVRDRARPRSR